MKVRYHICLGFLLVVILTSCENNSEKRSYTEIIVPSPLAERQDSTAVLEHSEIFSASTANDEPSPKQSPDLKSGENLTWETPSGWKEEPGQGMRLVTFVAGEGKEKVEVSIVKLAGAAGDLRANVVRWLGQIKLELKDDELAGFLSQAKGINTDSGMTGKIFDFTVLQKWSAADLDSMMTAMFEQPEGVIFVKMTGSKKVVLSEQKKFEQLCHSLKVH